MTQNLVPLLASLRDPRPATKDEKTLWGARELGFLHPSFLSIAYLLRDPHFFPSPFTSRQSHL